MRQTMKTTATKARRRRWGGRAMAGASMEVRVCGARRSQVPGRGPWVAPFTGAFVGLGRPDSRARPGLLLAASNPRLGAGRPRGGEGQATAAARLLLLLLLRLLEARPRNLGTYNWGTDGTPGRRADSIQSVHPWSCQGSGIVHVGAACNWWEPQVRVLRPLYCPP